MTYTRLLFSFNGMGGWNIQTDGLKLVARRSGIKDILLFAEYLEICASIMFVDDEEKKDKDAITEEDAENESP